MDHHRQAKAGVKIDYNFSAIRRIPSDSKLHVYTKLDTNIAILKLFPGIPDITIQAVLNISGLKAVILETYGAGNAPTSAAFLETLEQAIAQGLLVLNISQCPGGRVIQGRYETSRELQRIGVIGGADMTTEAAVTKLMVLLGEFRSEEIKRLISESLAGELSP